MALDSNKLKLTLNPLPAVIAPFGAGSAASLATTTQVPSAVSTRFDARREVDMSQGSVPLLWRAWGVRDGKLTPDFLGL